MSLYPPFYPPAYPMANPPPLVAERLLVNGVDLGSYTYMTTDVSSLLSVAARRGEDVVVAGRHGQIRRGGRCFDAGEIVLPMWVVGANPDGSIPSGGMEQGFFRRKDQLLQLFYADEVVLAFRRPDGLELSTRATVAEVMDFTRRHAEPLAAVSVALTLPDAFWTDTQDVSQSITGVTGTSAELTAFAGSTAPIADARITFHGPVSNPQLTIGDRWVRFNGLVAAGRQLVLECGHWRATSGAGPAWDPSEIQVYREPGPAWLEIPASYTPLTALFSHSGGGSATVEIAGNRKFLAA